MREVANTTAGSQVLALNAIGRKHGNNCDGSKSIYPFKNWQLLLGLDHKWNEHGARSCPCDGNPRGINAPDSFVGGRRCDNAVHEIIHGLLQIVGGNVKSSVCKHL